jgi:ABC-type bacteriocin/lantibiotic exporter with double-glycine peptidase domain
MVIAGVSLVLMLLTSQSVFQAVTTFHSWLPALATPASPSLHTVQRLSQMDPAQYSSPQEYQEWAASSCSAASMAEVINAYGHHYRVTDILSAERATGEITPDQGLLEDIGIVKTVARFRFTANLSYSRSLDQMISLANQGEPVIVSFPPQPAWPTGHILVVTGGDQSIVRVADSSRLDMHSLSRARFSQWWGGFSAVVTPQGSSRNGLNDVVQFRRGEVQL